MAVKSRKVSCVSNCETYEDAITKAGNGIFHHLLLLTCGLNLMIVIVESLNIGFVLPFIEADCVLKPSLSQKGFLNGAAYCGIVISSHFWGFLADTRGRKKTLHLCSLMTFITSLLSTLSLNIWMLILTRFFVGVFISCLAANSYTYMGEFYSDKTRAKQLSFAGVFIAVALTFCPGLAWLLMSLNQTTSILISISSLSFLLPLWRFYLLLCSSLSLITFFLLLLLPESPKFLLAQNREDEAVIVLTKIYRWNNRNSAFSYETKGISMNEKEMTNFDKNSSFIRNLWQQTVPLFTTKLKDTAMGSFIMFTIFAISSGFYMWVPFILSHIFSHSEENLGVCEILHSAIISNVITDELTFQCKFNVDSSIYSITFFMGLIFATIFLINGLIIDAVGKQNLLVVILMLCAVFGFVIPFTINLYVILVCLIGFVASGVCGNVLSSILVDLYETRTRAMALSVIFSFGRVGAVFGSMMVSTMIKNQCTEMFWVLGTLLIISSVTALFWLHKTSIEFVKKEKLEEI